MDRKPKAISRILRMTLRAPELVEVLGAGRPAPGLKIARVMEPLPAELRRQYAPVCSGAADHTFQTGFPPMPRKFCPGKILSLQAATILREETVKPL